MLQGVDLGVLLLDRIIEVLIQGMFFLSTPALKLCLRQSWHSCAATQRNLDEHFEALLAALQQDLEVGLLLDE